uniref:Neuro_bHLH domain-containing protein n=1 Tax=Caenorhabditis tropicalis TaxID=1561998 RepID=A0A1I7TWN4_9PELO
MLQTNEQPTPLQYAHTLANGLSQTTTNMLANLLQVQPRQLLPPSQFDMFSSQQLQVHPSHPNSFSSSSSSCSPPQYYYSPTQPSAAPLQASCDLAQYQRMYHHEQQFNYSP